MKDHPRKSRDRKLVSTQDAMSAIMCALVTTRKSMSSKELRRQMLAIGLSVAIANGLPGLATSLVGLVWVCLYLKSGSQLFLAPPAIALVQGLIRRVWLG